MQDGTNLHSDDELTAVTAHEHQLIERCANALLDLERRFGTRVLELSIDSLRRDDEYGARSRGAKTARIERVQASAQAIGLARGEDWVPLPVAAPLPTSADELAHVAGSEASA